MRRFRKKVECVDLNGAQKYAYLWEWFAVWLVGGANRDTNLTMFRPFPETDIVYSFVDIKIMKPNLKDYERLSEFSPEPMSGSTLNCFAMDKLNVDLI